MKAHVWLTGMMGTGKSTVGPLVAEQLGIPFLDVDDLLVAATGRTIPEIFAGGEAEFRGLERREIRRLAAVQEPMVIATGGGAVIDASNADVMRRTGTVVLLVAGSGIIGERVAGDPDRPLAGTPDDLARLAQARQHAYETAAHHIIDTSVSSPDAIAEEVLACIAM